jgi:hypothetical protein
MFGNDAAWGGWESRHFSHLAPPLSAIEKLCASEDSVRRNLLEAKLVITARYIT